RRDVGDALAAGGGAGAAGLLPHDAERGGRAARRAPARKSPRAYCVAAKNIHFLQRLGTDEVKFRPTVRYAFIFLTQVI
ncbi:hypothetical protein, partial [Burkholderia pseudomallei]|uniref:hypothetical protein n=1 Tax=Burkholderia pseudomallei TaxID=28450 RepID=UPI0015C2F6C7